MWGWKIIFTFVGINDTLFRSCTRHVLGYWGMKKLFSIGVLAVIGLFVFTACEKMGEDVGRHKGHKYVDLGLSVKWATCNVGANRPWEYGDYFAWGEVETKEDYYWHTYKYGGMRDGGREVVFLTKYCSDSVIGKDGFVDNKVILELEDDAASVNWGGNWRMPTKEEQDELRDSCEWVWTTQKGVSGCQVIGPNGNSIFLPAAGFMSYGRLTCYGDVPDGLVSDGSLGYYWTSSCSCIFMGDEACILSFYIDGYYPEGFILGNLDRSAGLVVRAVCP